MVRLSSRSMYIDKSLKTTLHVEDVLYFMTMNIPPEYIDTEEMHDFWEIVYLESGEAIATAGQQKVPLFPGDIIFHKPGEIHAIQSVNNTTSRAYFISFYSTSKACNIFDSLKTSLESDQKKMVHKLYDEARQIYLSQDKHYYSVIFSSTVLSPDAPTGAQQLFRIHLEELLISVIQLIEKKEDIIPYETKEELENLLFKKMIEKINDSIYSRISIDDLCNELNYGRTYLSILFKKYSGVSIMTYYNALKIEEAKKLISTGTLNMADISEKLHFNNQYYFSRVFKKITGVSLTEYKESL